MKYLLDMTQLRQGDIILEDGENKLVSNIIKKVTKSEFSHAMIYIDHTLIHAVAEGGVFSKNPQRILHSRKNSFKVLRLKEPVQNFVLDMICDNARGKVGSLYSKIEAGRSIRPKNTETKNKEQFCSRLVAQSYYEAGIKIVNNINYCTPEDINKSELLEEVSGCVKQASLADITMNLKKDPNLENQEETLKWLKQARQLLKKDGVNVQAISDIDAHLFKDSSTDKRICKYIESTKYLKLYNIDRDLNPYRYHESEFAMALDSAPELLAFEVDLNRREVVRHGKSLKVYRENYRTSKLKYCKLHVKLYRNLLKECEDRLNVILKYQGIDNPSSRLADQLLNEISSLLR